MIVGLATRLPEERLAVHLLPNTKLPNIKLPGDLLPLPERLHYCLQTLAEPVPKGVIPLHCWNKEPNAGRSWSISGGGVGSNFG